MRKLISGAADGAWQAAFSTAHHRVTRPASAERMASQAPHAKQRTNNHAMAAANIDGTGPPLVTFIRLSASLSSIPQLLNCMLGQVPAISLLLNHLFYHLLTLPFSHRLPPPSPQQRFFSFIF